MFDEIDDVFNPDAENHAGEENNPNDLDVGEMIGEPFIDPNGYDPELRGTGIDPERAAVLESFTTEEEANG